MSPRSALRSSFSTVRCRKEVATDAVQRHAVLLGQRHRPRGCEGGSRRPVRRLPANDWQTAGFGIAAAAGQGLEFSLQDSSWMAADAACRAAAQIDDRHSLETVPRRSARRHDQYRESLTRVRRNAKGQRIRPLKPSTRRTRFAELQAAARMAVANAIPIETLNSLAALLAPDIAGIILDAYWRSNGEQPKDFTINLAARFAAIAMETKCLNDDDCRALGDLRHTLEEYRVPG